MRFFITNHCKERYRERILGGSNATDNILITILKEVSAGTNITSKISEEYPRFILYLKERYGKKGYNFIRNKQTLYIATKRKGTLDLYDVLTCYVENNHLETFKNTALKTKDIYLKLKLLR